MGGGCLGLSSLVYMSSGMFRGKESSNRIELSRLVQELLNFGVLGSLQLWGEGWEDGVGVVGWGGGWENGVGVPPTHMHMHVHACTHMHAHVVNMIISCKWLPPLGNPWEFPMMSYACARACACMCMCVGGTLSPAPSTSTHPHPQGAQKSVKIQ